MENPLSESDKFVLQNNARNFPYYVDMVERIQESKCPFCDPMDKAKNPVLALNDSWRMWPCPPQLRAKGVAEHFVLAPIGDSAETHCTHIGSLTREEVVDFRDLLSKEIIPTLQGPTLKIGISPKLPIFHDPVHCECVVPDGTRRLEVSFTEDPVTDVHHFVLNQPIATRGRWMLRECLQKAPGLKFRALVHSNDRIANVSELSAVDFSNLINLAFLCGNELGFGVQGGAILMGLPGAAFTMRFGDPQFSAASIRHLHGNVKKPVLSGIITETLAKNPKDIEEKKLVTAAWEKMHLWIKANGKSVKDEAEAFEKALTPKEQALLRAREKKSK